MIYPEDWRQYKWSLESGNGVGTFSRGLTDSVRVWSVSAVAGAAGGTVTFINIDDSAPVVVTLPAGTFMTLSPGGMYYQTIDFSAGITVWIVEFIRLAQ